jgi:hypothetical protein
MRSNTPGKSISLRYSPFSNSGEAFLNVVTVRSSSVVRIIVSCPRWREIFPIFGVTAVLKNVCQPQSVSFSEEACTFSYGFIWEISRKSRFKTTPGTMGSPGKCPASIRLLGLMEIPPPLSKINTSERIGSRTRVRSTSSWIFQRNTGFCASSQDGVAAGAIVGPEVDSEKGEFIKKTAVILYLILFIRCLLISARVFRVVLLLCAFFPALFEQFSLGHS